MVFLGIRSLGVGYCLGTWSMLIPSKAMGLDYLQDGLFDPALVTVWDGDFVPRTNLL